jgi:nitrate reductase gamma subunit
MFYVAFIILVVGVISKVIVYFKTPTPLVIPTMPAPRTNSGVMFRILSEVVLFRSLFRSNKWIWAFGWTFHVGLLLVTLRHFRYFQADTWFVIEIIQPFGIYGGMVMVLGLLGLLTRRFVVERIRYISTPSDYLILILLIAIGISGFMMKYIAHTDVIAVKSFMLGLMSLDFSTPLPTDAWVLIHLGLVIVLMAIFPISKLMHAPGIFFSPTQNQKDDSREKRHVADWAKQLDRVES